jgi:oxygen-independent coproporphyrinogen-3 oxidase
MSRLVGVLIKTYHSITVPIDLLHPVSKPLDPIEFRTAQIPALYVHIPFCAHKCHYCDFYSITGQSDGRMDHFVTLLLAEADLWVSGGAGIKPQTVFFGGGTPTALSPAQMSRLIQGLRDRFDCSMVNEWTTEANPNTITPEYCDILREAGVNRISMGAQSFDRAELAMLERNHNPDDVPKCVRLAREAGFDRINVDLIYAIPGQTMESWQRSLESALSLKLSHLSCYGLTYEPNTPMTARKQMGQFVSAPEALELEMFHYTRERLITAGLEAYEISNFAALGQECRHNLLYWRGGTYIGLGPSAASHVDGCRFRNRPHLGEWERAVERAELPAIEVEHLTPRQRAGELVMLMLRLSEGVRYDDLIKRFGCEVRSWFSETIAHLQKLSFIQADADRFGLTRAGLDIADSVAAEFLE